MLTALREGRVARGLAPKSVLLAVPLRGQYESEPIGSGPINFEHKGQDTFLTTDSPDSSEMFFLLYPRVQASSSHS